MKIREEIREKLHNLYIIEQNSSSDIAEIYNVSNVTALKYLRKHNIPIRTNAEAQSTSVRQQKAKTTCIRKYGVVHQMHIQSVKEQIKHTNIIKYGVENPFQSKDIQEKIKETHMQNLGVEYPGQSAAVKEKIKESIQNKYGVNNPAQSPIIQRKIMRSGTKSKPYVFPSGRIVHIQGYEDIVLDKLLKIFSENDIIAGEPEKIPVISYIDNGVNRKYFPDIYIPKENLIIEVKSPYTYRKYKSKNLLKEQATIDAGYNYQLFIESRKQ